MEASQLIVILLYLGIVTFFIVSYWKVYEKANQPGWGCLVPFYNMYLMLKMGDKPGWWLILMLIPFVNIIFIIILS